MIRIPGYHCKASWIPYKDCKGNCNAISKLAICLQNRAYVFLSLQFLQNSYINLRIIFGMNITVKKCVHKNILVKAAIK